MRLNKHSYIKENVIIFICHIILSSGTKLDINGARDRFSSYVREYNKKYDSYFEHEKRLSIFAASLMEIEEHNAKNLSWIKAINEFSDMTVEEFRKKYDGGYVRKPFSSSKARLMTTPVSNLPRWIDWRDEGVITPVKKQKCKDCWANAATEQLESYLSIETKEPAQVLSVGQITACTSNPYQCGGTGGCDGAIESFAYQYAQLFGIVTETEYPYKTSWINKCRHNFLNTTQKVFVRGYESLPQNDYNAIMNHIAYVGPLSVTITVKWSDMKAYGGGIYKECSYDENIPLNHAVQLVGYGTDEEHGDYWLLRNSWGTSFGDQGYFKFAREKEVHCGENNTPLGGTACPGDGQTVQKVCGMCGVLFEASYPIGTSKTR